uniref:Secreted protein n=1 Tax=Arundo donax TaxID=35708 RepID=A0A0A9FVK3_ARUDO
MMTISIHCLLSYRLTALGPLAQFMTSQNLIVTSWGRRQPNPTQPTYVKSTKTAWFRSVRMVFVTLRSFTTHIDSEMNTTKQLWYIGTLLKVTWWSCGRLLDLAFYIIQQLSR